MKKSQNEPFFLTENDSGFNSWTESKIGMKLPSSPSCMTSVNSLLMQHEHIHFVANT